MPTTINIERKRGDTRRMTFVVKDGGTAVPIGSWTNFLMSITTEKAPVDATPQIAQFTGSLATDGSDGRVYFVPVGTEPVGTAYYDIQALDDNGEKVTIAEGSYKVTQDRTKD